MNHSRRTFTGALLLSAAAFSLRPRAALARAARPRGLSLSVDAVLVDAVLRVGLHLDNAGSSRTALDPEGGIAVILRHGETAHPAQGQFPSRGLSRRDRMSRVGPRPRRLFISEGRTTLEELVVPWPDAIPADATVTVSLELPLRIDGNVVVLAGEGRVTRSEA